MAPTVRVAAPRPPETAAPYRFPLLATVAPVLASVAIWLFTGSAFALIFAAIGPITAVASLFDALLTARRTTRRELIRFHGDADAVQRTIESHHAGASARVRARHPTGAELAERSGGDPHRWAWDGDGAILVNLGAGTAPSSIVLDPPIAGGVRAAEVDARIEELSVLARRSTDAPLLADARLGIGITGSDPVTHAAARSVLLQLARSLSPAEFSLSLAAPSTELAWTRLLPHPLSLTESDGDVLAQFKRSSDGSLAAILATSAESVSLPSVCRIAVAVEPSLGARIVQHPDQERCGPVELAFVSREQASSWARDASRIAVRDGLVAKTARLPTRIALADISAAPEIETSWSTIPARFLVGENGAVAVDLVRDGPHAVVGGATGSGKSELLISWVVSLAAAHSPEAVSFLLVDFKGGAAFAALEALPHTVGIITDLDEAEAARALASLRAEMHYRERTLAAANARDIADVDGLPRLVIVVDEFATVIEQHGELHTLFSDIAARGRSLGVHLILCTQRPGVTVRDAVLANADLRVSLRVNNRTDSIAVVGSDAAATLDAAVQGRAILASAALGQREVHVAVSDDADLRTAAERWQAAAPPRRPWCEPLPTRLTREQLERMANEGASVGAARGGIPFGLIDQPQRQRQTVASYAPQADGNLLVIGGPGSGKSTLLHVLAGSDGARFLPRSVDAAWDEVARIGREFDRGPADRGHAQRGAIDGQQLVLIDDIDSLLMRFSPDHRSEFIARLSRVLRDGTEAGLAIAMTTRRISSEVQPIAALVSNVFPLAPANRQELTLLGLDGAQFVPGLPPGGGIWRGDRVQVLFAEPGAEAQHPSSEGSLDGARPLAVVSGHVAATTDRLRSIGCAVVPLGGAVGDPRELALSHGARWTAIVGDAEEWQSRWGALASLRPVADILIQHCSVSEFRSLTRSRELPPPLADESALCWRWRADGGIDRVRLALPGA